VDDTIRSEEDLVLNEVTSQGLSGFESFDPGDIQGATSRGIVVSFAAQGGRFLVQFGYSVALARMLTPADFGVVAMAAPVTAFVQLFSDFGLTQATVQRPKISDAELSFMLWMSIAVSSLLGVVTIAAAPLVSLFYKR
jgi:PST family polysaccharide transporter